MRFYRKWPKWPEFLTALEESGFNSWHEITRNLLYDSLKEESETIMERIKGNKENGFFRQPSEPEEGQEIEKDLALLKELLATYERNKTK